MKKYTVMVKATETIKVMEFDNYNTAAKMAVKYKDFAFGRKLHWTISFFTDRHLDAQITT